MNIEQSISDLLYRNQCVIIPGFGAILTEAQSAQWSESSETFFPPKKNLYFNSSLKNNDGLLANHISNTEKIPYDIAVENIKNQVNIWFYKLDINGFLVINDIGEFIFTSDKKIFFTPNEQINYLTESFGLSSIVAPTIPQQEITEIEAETTEIIELNPTKLSQILKYVAIIIFAVSLLVPTSIKLYNNQVVADKIAIEQNVQRKIENKIQEATFVIVPPILTEDKSVDSLNFHYHIVAGAFKEIENAEKTIKELKEKGYDAKKIEPNKYGLFPVIYGSYATYKEAKEVLKNIIKAENPEAWLLIK